MICARHPSGHLDQILPQQPFGGAVLAAVAVLAERARHPGVDLGPPFAFESNLFAGVEKLLDLLQVQLAGVLHVDGQSPACPLPDPLGSSCMRQDLVLTYPAKFGTLEAYRNYGVSELCSPFVRLLSCQGRSKFGPLRRSKSRPVGERVAVFVGRLERSLRSPFRAAQA